jgi:hypothetical protein
LLGKNTRFFDCLVGYFFISGFHRLHPALSNTEKIRVLIGIKTDGATVDLIQTAKAQQEFVLESHAQVRERVPGEILNELQKSGDSSEIEDGIHKFVQWIKSGKLEVRAYPSDRLTPSCPRGRGAKSFVSLSSKRIPDQPVIDGKLSKKTRRSQSFGKCGSRKLAPIS